MPQIYRTLISTYSTAKQAETESCYSYFSQWTMTISTKRSKLIKVFPHPCPFIKREKENNICNLIHHTIYSDNQYKSRPSSIQSFLAEVALSASHIYDSMGVLKHSKSYILISIHKIIIPNFNIS